MPKELPAALTSYDLLKTLAVVLMIVDHIGYYFFPFESEFRVAGRWCVPIWFFLIGYANSRDLGWKLWLGAVVLIVANLIVGMPVFPLNILATMILLRLVIDGVGHPSLSSMSIMLGWGFIAIALAIYSEVLWEYGTLALPFALFGYMCRHRDKITSSNDALVIQALVAVISFVIVQAISFKFSVEDVWGMAAGVVIVTVILYFFRPHTFTAASSKLPAGVVVPLQFFGRYTLEIYVLHLILFKVVSVALGIQPFTWFEPSFFYTLPAP